MNRDNLNRLESEQIDEELLTALETERQQLFDNELEQDAIFDCPFEMHELVADIDISNAIMELKDTHKEILYYLAIRQYSCQQIACIRGQSDRNIRKVRDTLLKKLREKILSVLEERIRKGIPISRIEKEFVHDNESEVY